MSPKRPGRVTPEHVRHAARTTLRFCVGAEILVWLLAFGCVVGASAAAASSRITTAAKVIVAGSFLTSAVVFILVAGLYISTSRLRAIEILARYDVQRFVD